MVEHLQTIFTSVLRIDLMHTSDIGIILEVRIYQINHYGPLKLDITRLQVCSTVGYLYNE